MGEQLMPKGSAKDSVETLSDRCCLLSEALEMHCPQCLVHVLVRDSREQEYNRQRCEIGSELSFYQQKSERLDGIGARIDVLREAVALLSSMVASGEAHTKTSRRVVAEAMGQGVK